MFVQQQPESKHRDDRQQGCCCVRTSHRVQPSETTAPGYKMVETSAGRVLRVRHVNPAPRDPQLEAQMRHFMSNEYPKDIMSNTGPQSTSNGVVAHHASPEVPVRSASTRTQRTKSAGPVRSSQSKLPNQTASPVKTNHMVKSDTRSHTARTTTSVLVNLETKDFSDDDDIEEIPFTPINSHASMAKTKLRQRAEPIFLLHGVGGSSDVWQGQVNYFEELGYEVLVPDLLGHGFSSALPESKAYLFKNIAKDILYIFDSHCKQRNIIIGHSYGASFACYLARERASWVSHLVLISGGSPTPLAPQPGVFGWSVCCLACCRPIIRKQFDRSAFHTEEKTNVPREKAFDVPTYVLKYMMNGQQWVEGTHEYHSEIKVPTLLLHGAEDRLISLYEEEEMILAIPNSELVVVDDASHMVMMEQPVKVNKFIYEFLQKHTANR